MANKYYQESKDWLRKKASEKYRNLSEKKKKKNVEKFPRKISKFF